MARNPLNQSAMKHFTKTACVLDTCSIINLDDIELARKDILYYMRQFFDVRVCQTIRKELQQHTNLVSSREITYWKRFLSNRTHLPTTLTNDQDIIGPFYSTPPATFGVRDKGEHGNARVALELLLTNTIGHAVFVTDDEKASNSFLKSMRQSFPGINLWTSADVILYVGAVLLKERKTSFDDVKAALRNVYAAGAKKWSDRTESEKDKIIRKSSKSVGHLKLIKKVTDHWRH